MAGGRAVLAEHGEVAGHGPGALGVSCGHGNPGLARLAHDADEKVTRRGLEGPGIVPGVSGPPTAAWAVSLGAIGTGGALSSDATTSSQEWQSTRCRSMARRRSAVSGA